jgi:hypothetical protein
VKSTNRLPAYSKRQCFIETYDPAERTLPPHRALGVKIAGSTQGYCNGALRSFKRVIVPLENVCACSRV